MASKPRAPRLFFENTVKSYEGDDCLIWPFANVRGYGVIRINRKNEYVCRLVCEGEPPEGKPHALHSCGNGANGCVNRKHLYWGSQKENVADTFAHGRGNNGERNGAAKLTEDDVREIHRLSRETNLRQYEIAERFGVGRKAVNDILRRKNWAWVDI